MTRVIFFLVGALLWTVPPVRAAEAPYIRGMTVSCQTGGREWGTPGMGTSLDRLKKIGVNYVAIHPYAQIREDGAVKYRPIEEQTHLLRAMAMAKERGLGLMMIPHLAYWGTKFKWRGEIYFPAGPMWDHFFDEYEAWIVGLARLAEQGGAEIFSIGHEYDHMMYYEAQWRRIIAAVRKVYHGKITYNANWSEYEKVPFWDALDYIGIGAYFPLAYKDGAPQEEIDATWTKLAKELGAYSRAKGRPILFTEIGYTESAEAASRPWNYDTGGPNAKDIRQRCTEAALKLEGSRFPELAGLFFWKWFPDVAFEMHRENFDMRDPDMTELLQQQWAPN